MGGELKGLSKLTSDVRDELIYELKEKAATLGANAVVGLRWGREGPHSREDREPG